MTRTYGYAAVRVLLAVCGGVAAVAVGAMWMGLVEHTAWETPGFVALLLLTAVAMWRGATVRVVVDGAGFLVRNPLRTHRVAWADVRRVRWRQPWFWRWFARSELRCPCLEVRGGRKVYLFAMLDLGDRRYARVVKEWQRR